MQRMARVRFTMAVYFSIFHFALCAHMIYLHEQIKVAYSPESRNLSFDFGNVILNAFKGTKLLS